MTDLADFSDMQRFDHFWVRNFMTDCWEWIGATHKQGYGNFHFRGKARLAHRVSWVLHHGQVLEPCQKVCHQCDNPRCVNPNHLFIGTQKANMQDAGSKGRLGKADVTGTKNPAAIFSDNQVRAILRDRRKLREIAAEYECAVSTVSMIKNGKNWPHLFSEWQSENANKRAEMRL